MGENPQHNNDNTKGWPPPTPPNPYQYEPQSQQPFSPYGGTGQKRDTFNTLAIVSFVLSFFVSIAAVVTGHLALGQIRRTGEKGWGLAIAGLVIGYASIVAAVIAGIFLIAFWSSFVTIFLNDYEGSKPATSEQGYASEAPVGAANMNAFGGITLGADGAVIAPTVRPEDADFDALEAASGGMDNIGIAASAAREPAQAVVYLDFECSHCADFETDNGVALKKLRDQGKITVEYRPVALLNATSPNAGFEPYSTLAAEAAVCVADQAPEKFVAYVSVLLDRQPEPGATGPDENMLAILAAGVGAPDLRACLYNGEVTDFVDESSYLATTYGITGVPAVYLDGQKWDGTDFTAFSEKVLAAKK